MHREFSHAVILSEAKNPDSALTMRTVTGEEHNFTREDDTTQFVSKRVRRESNSARLVRASNLRDRRDLFANCGVRRQSPALPAQLPFVCLPSLCPPRSRAFFRRRIAQVCGHTPRPDHRESRIPARISRLLRDCSCLRIVAHRGSDENNQLVPLQLARSCAPRFFSRAEIILAEKSLICASVSVASRL